MDAWLHGLWDCRLLTVSYVLVQLSRVGPDAPALSKFLGHPRLLPMLEPETVLPLISPTLASSHNAGVTSEETSSEQSPHQKTHSLVSNYYIIGL